MTHFALLIRTYFKSKVLSKFNHFKSKDFYLKLEDSYLDTQPLST